eukprot:227612-Rhodomonas_salina.1
MEMLKVGLSSWNRGRAIVDAHPSPVITWNICPTPTPTPSLPLLQHQPSPSPSSSPSSSP